MLSKKILIEGNEAYIQSNLNPVGEVNFNWIVNSILRKIELVRINHDFVSDVMVYDVLKKSDEILNLNGFDYSVTNPDYSLIEIESISLDRKSSSILIPNASFQSVVNLAPITAVSLFPINDAFRKEFGSRAQENIVDFENADFRQPFFANITVTDETALEAADGTINFEDAWGGGALEYSVDDGATWSEADSFINMEPGTYNCKMKDDQGNESIVRVHEIKAFVPES